MEIKQKSMMLIKNRSAEMKVNLLCKSLATKNKTLP